MLSLFIIWFYIAFLSFTYGLLWLEIMAATGYVKTKTLVPLEILLVSGSGFLSVILSVLHFWLPISFTVHLLLVTGSLILLWHFKKDFQLFLNAEWLFTKKAWPYFLSLLTFLLLVLWHAAQPVTAPDSGFYHAQTIQWYEKYQIIIGLGNLNGHLAFNSHAHLLMSLFDLSFLQLQTFHAAWGSFIYILYISYALRHGFRAIVSNQSPWAIYYFGSLILGFAFFRNWISSPTPDPVVMFFLLFLFSILLPDKKPVDLSWQLASLGLLMPVLITFKNSAAFGIIPIMAAWHFFNPKQNVYWFRFVAFHFLIILVPYFIRNLLLSGYFLYPFLNFDLFSPTWQIPAYIVENIKINTIYFSRTPVAEWQNFIGVPLSEWVSIWWSNQNRIDKIFLILFLFTLPICIFKIITDKVDKISLLNILWGSSILCSLLVFITVPALRFSYGYSIPAFLLGCIIIARKIKISNLFIFSPMLILIVLDIIGIYQQVNRSSLLLIWPVPYPKAITVIRHINNIKTSVALGDGRCWNAPLPCTDPELPLQIELRGKEIKYGFKPSN